MMTKINIIEKFKSINEHWSPKIIGELNGQHVKLAKFKGEFVWHHHENEDELFLVIRGRLLMRLRDKDIWVEEGEMIVIPAKVEHMPVAPEEVLVLLFEPASTLNTGNVIEERTRSNLDRI